MRLRKIANNLSCFETMRLSVWFSYETPVAFRKAGGPVVVRENDWKQTTGKHLNLIDGGNVSSRVPGAQFVTMLHRANI